MPPLTRTDLRITRVCVWAVELPLAKPYALSGGRLRFERLDSTLVKVETNERDICGWGEGCPWGHSYLPAHGGGVRAALALLAPALIGQNPLALESINRRMDECLPGHPYAKSPLDIACWDIAGHATQQPLWLLLGAQTPAPIALNSSIGTDTPEAMVASIEAARAAGYRTHSAKIGGADLAADRARMKAILTAALADEHITFDINRAWTPATAIELLNQQNITSWVEQPCETLEQCAQVNARVSCPIMLDECLHDYNDHLRAWQLRACEGIKLKPNRVGGLTKAKHIHTFAMSVGWRMHIEDVGGSVLADTAALHLAAATPAEHRLASWLCHPHLKDDWLSEQGARNHNGTATLSNKHGIGITIGEATEAQLGTPTAIYS